MPRMGKQEPDEDAPKTAVVNVREGYFDVYIGRETGRLRGSKWGNPFVIGKDGNRTEVLSAYALWVRRQPELMASLEELRGKALGCWCVEEPVTEVRAEKVCHGEVLLQLLAENPRK